MQPIKIFIAACALAATAALAQPPGGPGHGGFGGPGPGGPPEANLERLAVLLDLDPYQKQEVERVLKEQRDTMQAERKALEGTGERPSFADIQSRREHAREDTITKLQGVLSELQITKLKLLLPAEGGRGGRPGPPRSGGDNPAADGN
jgi:hypothetical protein